MDNKPICKIDNDGTKRWYNEDGAYHRLDGPAIEHYDGEKRWYKNGDLHRLDGPAVIWHVVSDWYINDYYVTEKINKWAKDNNIDLDNLTDVDKALIKIVWADYDGE